MNTDTPHQLTTQVKLLQKVVLLHRDTFLILKRAEGPGYRSGKWDLPGGNSEWPTATQDVKNPHLVDLVREVQEETGIVLDVTDPSTLTSCYVCSYFEAHASLYTIIVGWQSRLLETDSHPVVQLSSEHVDLAWITATEFDIYDFGFAGEKDGFIRQIVEHTRE